MAMALICLLTYVHHVNASTVVVWGYDAGMVSNAPKGTGFTAIASESVDGYALTSEPATLLLLGLGGLAVIRKRS